MPEGKSKESHILSERVQTGSLKTATTQPLKEDQKKPTGFKWERGVHCGEGEIRTRTTVGHDPLKIAYVLNNQLVILLRHNYDRNSPLSTPFFWLYPKKIVV